VSNPAPRLPLDPGYLRDLFSRNARTYDSVNLLISLGLVRRWRRYLVGMAQVRAEDRVLDAFCGPGSLGVLATERLGSTGEVVFADLSPAMLQLARMNMRLACQARERRSACPTARFVQTDVLNLPAQETFDLIFLGFALRYTADPSASLDGLARLLRPGGRIAVLEFTGPREGGARWTALPRWYFHRLLPILAGRLGRGREVYDYLSASSASFLTPDELDRAARDAGLSRRVLREKMGGLVCLLVGFEESAQVRPELQAMR
jgi:demethylmenaquinone methyltransferase/2-methoxy-6-polyprenyl-1,4-benzoquinol methylase